ncbi:MAG: hypothetical protein GY772_02795, partial [bacterium]|nr:hypothetical protein [bacterium]
MKRLVAHLGLEVDGRSRAALLQAVAIAAADGDEEFGRHVLERENLPIAASGPAYLADDPVFELAYEEMDVEDKQEFPEVGEAIKRKRAHRHVVHARVRKGLHRPAAKRRRTPAAEVGATARSASTGAACPTEHHEPLADAGDDAAAQLVEAAGPIERDEQRADAVDDAAVQGVEAAGPIERDEQLADAVDDAAVQGVETAGPIERAQQGPRIPRAEVWAQGRSVLAMHFTRGEFRAWLAMRRRHKADAQRCNKSLSVGGALAADEAKRRIQEWCLKGVDVPDVPGGKHAHMYNPEFEPRHLVPRAAEQLEAVARNL